jgi:hypothetical protein
MAADRPDRLDPGWARLWDVVRPGLDTHPIDPGNLGEYALLVHERGPAVAEQMFPTVAAHLAGGCEQCAEDLQDLAAQTSEVRADGLAPVDRLLDQVRRVLVAVLVPPPAQALTAAQRGAGGDESRTYRAGSLSISLYGAAAPPWAGGGADLEGLVVDADMLPGGLAGTSAQLITPDGVAHIAPIDELGNFRFEGVSPGRYRLELLLADRSVIIEDLALGS